MVIPKLKLGLKARDKIEEHPDAANKLVHSIYDMLHDKLQEYFEKTMQGEAFNMS